MKPYMNEEKLKLFRRCFRWINSKMDIRNENISKKIENACEMIAQNVFISHTDSIIKNESIYIISSVWGFSPDGSLDEHQKEIFSLASFQVNRLLNELNSNNLKNEQLFAFQYLINAYVVLKIIYMKEIFRNMVKLNEEIKRIELKNLFSSTNPIGEA